MSSPCDKMGEEPSVCADEIDAVVPVLLRQQFVLDTVCFPREMEVQSEVAFVAVKGVECVLDEIIPVAQVRRASAV